MQSTSALSYPTKDATEGDTLAECLAALYCAGFKGRGEPKIAMELRVSREVVERFLEPCYGGRDRVGELLQMITRAPRVSTVRANEIVIDTASLVGDLALGLGQRGHRVEASSMAREIVLIGPRPATSLEVPCETVGVVVVDVRCGEAVLRGADVFAPGVVSADLSVAVGSRVLVLVDIGGTLRHGENVAKMAGPRRVVGRGVAEMSREQLFCSATPVKGVAVRTCSALPSLDSLRGTEVTFVAQNLPSLIA